MLGAFDPAALAASLQLMWQGMLGIFAVMGLIAVLVLLLTKFTK